MPARTTPKPPNPPPTTAAKTVNYGLERLMQGATLLKCSGFGEVIVKHTG